MLSKNWLLALVLVGLVAVWGLPTVAQAGIDSGAANFCGSDDGCDGKDKTSLDCEKGDKGDKEDSSMNWGECEKDKGDGEESSPHCGECEKDKDHGDKEESSLHCGHCDKDKDHDSESEE